MSKAKTQPWLEYLLNTIEKDVEPGLSKIAATFRQADIDYRSGVFAETELRSGLIAIKEEVLKTVRAKHHADKLMSATIEYIVNPDKRF